MGRTTVYNNITSPEKIAMINKENITLVNDFLEYLESIGRAQTTIKNYRADLQIFFCWVLDELENKSFIKITKREIAKFQNHAMKVWGWSTCRLRTVKAALSSLGNFIEQILDDEYDGFRSIVKKVESPPKQAVREKTVWSDDDVTNLLSKLVERKEYEKACLIALAAFGGRRKSELCRFKVSDFDESKLVCDGALYKSDPIKTKGRGGGKIVPCYTLAKKFKPYFDLWMKEREQRGIDSIWLFPNDKNHAEQIKTTTIDSWCTLFSKLSGKDIYLHSLRHRWVSSLSEAGVPDAVIQSIGQWESVDMVRLYDDTPKDEKIAEYFKDGDICVKQANSIENLQ